MLNKIRTIRKRWLIASATAVLLAAGLMAGAVFAVNSPIPALGGHAGLAGERAGGIGNHDATYDRFIQRVAEILGIESETVGSAFATAQHELADEQFATKMDTLVEDGTLTREQADAANAWFTARPADAGRIAYIAVGTADADKVAQILQKAVDNGALTQEQADAISAWHTERPDSLPEHRIGHDRDGGRHHGGRGHDRDGDSGHDGDGDAGHAG